MLLLNSLLSIALLTHSGSNLSYGASQCMPLSDLKADFLDEESSLTLELRDFTVCALLLNLEFIGGFHVASGYVSHARAQGTYLVRAHRVHQLAARSFALVPQARRWMVTHPCHTCCPFPFFLILYYLSAASRQTTVPIKLLRPSRCLGTPQAHDAPVPAI
jgi:hypothetical protein